MPHSPVFLILWLWLFIAFTMSLAKHYGIEEI